MELIVGECKMRNSLLLLLFVFIEMGCSSHVFKSNADDYIELKKSKSVCNLVISYNGELFSLSYSAQQSEDISTFNEIEDLGLRNNANNFYVKLPIEDGKEIGLDMQSCKVIKNEPSFLVR